MKQSMKHGEFKYTESQCQFKSGGACTAFLNVYLGSHTQHNWLACQLFKIETSFNHFYISINPKPYLKRLQDPRYCEHLKTKMKIEPVWEIL